MPIDRDAVRVHVVLRRRPGLTPLEILSAIREQHYVSSLDQVIEALERRPALFRLARDGSWTAIGSSVPASEGGYDSPSRSWQMRSLRRMGYSDVGSELDEAPDVFAERELSERGGSQDTIRKINEARAHRGDPVLDEAEMTQVLGNLQRWARDPNRYVRGCWYCQAIVDAATNERCPACRWFVCWCGACMQPQYPTAGDRAACRRELRVFGQALPPDVDDRGRPILTPREPAHDAEAIRALSAAHGVKTLFHWSPLRAVPSIMDLGIMSRRALANRRIAFVPRGYGSHDKEERLAPYVALSINVKRQMMAAWSDHPIVWEIDAEVVTSGGVLFVAGNTARADLQIETILASSGHVAYVRMLEQVRAQRTQSEILVPDWVPRAAIRRVLVTDSSAERAVREALAASSWPGLAKVAVAVLDG